MTSTVTKTSIVTMNDWTKLCMNVLIPCNEIIIGKIGDCFYLTAIKEKDHS